MCSQSFEIIKYHISIYLKTHFVVAAVFLIYFIIYLEKLNIKNIDA